MTANVISPISEVQAPHELFDTLLILDFGSQYSHSITRRLRKLNVFSELLPCTQKIAELPFKPMGVILSGGPYSVYDADAPHIDPAVFDLDVPILGICYGLQEMAWQYDQQNVLAGEKKEYGHAKLTFEQGEGRASSVNVLFQNVPNEIDVWMSHGDKLSHLPESFSTIAKTSNAPFAGIAHNSKPYYGIQFHPEVSHTSHGTKILENFAVQICKARQHWTMEEFLSTEISRIRALVGDKGQVIGAVSGGVDSSVAAKLMQEAIGDRFHAVLVDNGLLRHKEAETVYQTLTLHLGINLTVIDARERFFKALKEKFEPEEKRKIIGDLFIKVFQETADEFVRKAADSPNAGDIEWLLQGTLYPDVIESRASHGPSQTIKTHHNVGGLPKDMKFKLIEPLRELFKDEVRVLGTKLGMPEELVWRHPFPGPGLGIRVLGEVTPDQVEMARQADRIFIDEIIAAGLYRKISQAYAALLPIQVVGIKGDKRAYEQPIVLRAVVTEDFMTASWYYFDRSFLEKVSLRITNEVSGICHVFQSITGKPPGTIELG